jgi:hypothetical protein
MIFEILVYAARPAKDGTQGYKAQIDWIEWGKVEGSRMPRPEETRRRTLFSSRGPTELLIDCSAVINQVYECHSEVSREMKSSNGAALAVKYGFARLDEAERVANINAETCAEDNTYFLDPDYKDAIAYAEGRAEYQRSCHVPRRRYHRSFDYFRAIVASSLNLIADTMISPTSCKECDK